MDGTADVMSAVGWHLYIARGFTGVGSYTVGYTGVGSYRVRWGVLELVAIECGGVYWSW